MNIGCSLQEFFKGYGQFYFTSNKRKKVLFGTATHGTTTEGFEPSRGNPTSLAGMHLNRSVKLSNYKKSGFYFLFFVFCV